MKDKGNEFDMDEKMKELAEKENISFLKTLLKFKNKDTSIKTSSPKEVSKYHTINEKSIEPKNSDIKEEKKSNVVIISDLNQINTEPISIEETKNIKPNEEAKKILDNSISSIQSLEQEMEQNTKKVVVDNKKANTIDNKNNSQSISKRSTFYNTAKSIREIEQLMRATKQIEKSIQMKSYATQKHFNITYQKKSNTPALTKTDHVPKSKYQSSFKELGVQKELYNQKGKNKVKKIVIRNQKIPLNSYYQEAKKNQKILLTEQSKGNYKNKSTSLRGNTNNKTKSKSLPKFIKKVKESEKGNLTVKKYSIMKNKENQYCIVNKK